MLSSGPPPISHTTVQHINDPDIIDSPRPIRSQAPPTIDDPHEDLGTSDSDDDSIPSLGDPKPEFFGEMTPPSISLIGAAAFKQLIDVGEEVYTIHIQLTSNYLDITALQAIGNQPTPTSALHSDVKNGFSDPNNKNLARATTKSKSEMQTVSNGHVG